MRAQDEAEYAELVAAVTHRVHRVAYVVCGDRQLAEDAVQSALMSAYRTWPRVRMPTAPRPTYGRWWSTSSSAGADGSRGVGPSHRGRGPEPSRASHENEVVEHQLISLAVVSCRRGNGR